jgi:hypothetical protein
MTRAGWLILKWLILPAALAAIGYYIIGPRLGNLPVPGMIQAPAIGTSHDDATDADKGKQTNFPSPDVDVKVGSVAHGEHPKPTRHHRRHAAQKPAETPPTQTAPPGGQDQGGGATTTGGTDG